MRNARIIRLFGMAMIGLCASRLGAQNPTKLPTVNITANAAHRIVGIVTDTSGIPIEGADVTIPSLERRATTRADGSFQFDSVPKGKLDVRARKLGFAPQVQQVTIDTLGGRIDNFELVPITQLLPAMVAGADRLGLSGVVADTSFQSLSRVVVKVLGKGMVTTTDSLGAFYIPLMKPGNYMIMFGKDSFADRLVSVTMPADSGRRITVSLGPYRARSHSEANNFLELNTRIAWEPPGSHQILTRESLEKAGIEWAQDAVAQGARLYGNVDPPDKDCYATVDGGPAITKIQDVSVDEIESVEMLGSSQIRGAIRSINTSNPAGGPAIGSAAKGKPLLSLMFTNYKRAADANRGKRCGLVNIWSRR